MYLQNFQTKTKTTNDIIAGNGREKFLMSIKFSKSIYLSTA